MDNLNKDDNYLILVLFVGFIASILNLETKDFSKIKYKILSYLLSFLSSMFLCWISYEIFFFFLNNIRVSVALAGFVTWRGTDWIYSKIDKALDKRIERN
ncbi:hypothetical protein [Campylobacter concisus]|uniref:hypothetical protein n=1 Tax=Campylobacter concisus TaxID=199 RepID=UPI000D314B1A|nr:hypothetical protein [Campylobacter concisus]